MPGIGSIMAADLVAAFRDALERVPRVLLSSEDMRVLRDAQTSADVLDNLLSSPMSVVLVGCTGVGKSHLVNELVGAEVSKVGVLRPTTRSVVAAGSMGPGVIEHAFEYVVVPAAAEGLVFVDTPGWEVDREAAAAALSSADLAIVVVSPSRYGDAQTRDLWDAAESTPQRTVVLNRLGGPSLERSKVLASVRSHFAGADVVTVDEGGRADQLSSSVLGAMARRSTDGDKIAITRAAASRAGRYIAGAVTARATDLGRLGDTVDAAPPQRITDRGLAVLESWLATEQELVDHVQRSIHDLDREIIDTSGSEVSQRMLETMGQWSSAAFENSLVQWRSEAADRFRSDAKIRWRRSSAEQLLDQTSWKVGVNPTVQVAGRVKRLMGANLDSAIRDIHGQLVDVANDEALRRRGVWRSAVEAVGTFKPGELLAAARAVGER